jgi:hypothetical protein
MHPGEIESWRRHTFPPRHKLAIYIWELPTHLSLRSLVDTARPAFPPKDFAKSELAFLYTLLGDEVVRVRSPWEANLHLAPMFAWGLAYGFGGDLLVGRMKRIISWLRSNEASAPLFEKYGGRDFIFWAAGDLASCTLKLAWHRRLRLLRRRGQRQPGGASECDCRLRVWSD